MDQIVKCGCIALEEQSLIHEFITDIIENLCHIEEDCEFYQWFLFNVWLVFFETVIKWFSSAIGFSHLRTNFSNNLNIIENRDIRLCHGPSLFRDHDKFCHSSSIRDVLQSERYIKQFHCFAKGFFFGNRIR